MMVKNGRRLKFEGLVVKFLSDDILGSMPFFFKNDIGIRPAKSQIIIDSSEVIPYDSEGVCEPMVRRSDVPFVLRSPNNKTVVFPGESLTLQTPVDAEANSCWALEPRHDHGPQDWFPPADQDHEITIINTTDAPQPLKDRPKIIDTWPCHHSKSHTATSIVS